MAIESYGRTRSSLPALTADLKKRLDDVAERVDAYRHDEIEINAKKLVKADDAIFHTKDELAKNYLDAEYNATFPSDTPEPVQEIDDDEDAEEAGEVDDADSSGAATGDDEIDDARLFGEDE